MSYDWRVVDECCDVISGHINDDSKPFMAGNIGSNELNCLLHTYSGQLIDPSCLVGEQCGNIAGIYPINDSKVVVEFYKSMMNAVKQMDGIFYSIDDEDSKNQKKLVQDIWKVDIPEKYNADSLDIIHTNTWIKHLQGKKVLVVSPFKETIKSQYAKRKHWDMMGWCPEFESIEVVQSRYPRSVDNNGFDNWMDEYKRMHLEIQSLDFDIAILGCGSFGLPLAGRIKAQMDRSAIHMGGTLQNMFGIKGQRWMMKNNFSCFMNSAWVKPFHAEIPSDVKKFTPSFF